MTTIRPTSTVRPAAPATRPANVAAPSQAAVRVLEADQPNPIVRAIAAVRDGIRWVMIGPTLPEWKTRQELADPDPRWASATERERAITAVEANRLAEEAALARLGDRAEGFRALSMLCLKDPMAREALQKLLLDGRLTAKKDLTGQGDLLHHLSRLADQPLVSGVDRTELVTCLIEELEQPTKTQQEYRGTCVATTATILASRKNPAEVARLVADLARPEGTAQMANGDTLTRSATWANADDGNRTPSVRLLQPALMDYGNFFLRYDNDRDMHTLSQRSVWESLKDGVDRLRRKVALPGGLEGWGSNRVLEALTGENFTTVHTVTRLNRNSAWNRVEAALKAGHSVPVGLMWEGGGHKVLFDRIEGDHVYYTNPWGISERMAIAEAKTNLMDANLPPG
ncbi:MAG: hypothetical protein ACK46X_11065 [Candidatus Sericytochromatia bacterium]